MQNIQDKTAFKIVRMDVLLCLTGRLHLITQHVQRHSVTSAVCADRASASEKVPRLVCFFFSFAIEHTVVFFFFFSPNPVKLFLRANQCLHTSAVQLINETPLILLLSAFFVSLFLLPSSSSSSALSHHIPPPSILPLSLTARFLAPVLLFLLYLNLVAILSDGLTSSRSMQHVRLILSHW